MGMYDNKYPPNGSVEELSMGRMGGLVISDTSAHTGTYGAFQAITNCVISAITPVEGWLTTALPGLTLAAGTILRISYTSITLTSGDAVLYNQ